MLKTVKNAKKKGNVPYSKPLRCQDLIPIDEVSPDGTIRAQKQYSKMYRLQDINYAVASKEDKLSLMEKYMTFLNTLDNGEYASISIYNHKFDDHSLGHILLAMKGDDLDEYRQEYNQMLKDKAKGSQGITQDKFLTLSTFEGKNIKEAEHYFSRLEGALGKSLSGLSSSLTPLDIEQRLKVYRDFYRYGEERPLPLQMQKSARLGHNVKDTVVPDSMEVHRDYMVVGNRYVRALHLREYATYIRDSFLSDLTSLPKVMVVTLTILPIPIEEAQKEIEKVLLGVETNITNWQRKQNKNNNFSAIIPYDMEMQRKESLAFLDALKDQDEKMMLCTFTVLLSSPSKEALEEDTKEILSVAGRNMCQMAPLHFQQVEGMQTALPFGLQKIHSERTLTTRSLAYFTPFNVLEILDDQGIYYGQNAISHNLILCNKEKLQNQSSFILGVPGSGKSFITKEQIAFLMLNTDDDILICDPEGEYSSLVATMGNQGKVITLTADGKDRLNAMELELGMGEDAESGVTAKTQFLLSLFERLKEKESLTSQERSLIDRAVRQSYLTCREKGTVPTLQTLYQCLLSYAEPEAKQLALTMEIFTTGSFKLFGGEGNVSLNKRITSFDIHKLESSLKPTGLLVITDTMLNRVAANSKKGKRTHIFIDEFHVVFDNKESAQFFDAAWRQFRKRNAFPTAITQNVSYLLDNESAQNMLSNSEFVVMLNQSANDQARLCKLLHISKEQLSYINGAKSGCGLIKYGSLLVPFVNEFPKDTKLYHLMTTKPGEWDRKEDRLGQRKLLSQFWAEAKNLEGKPQKDDEEEFTILE